MRKKNFRLHLLAALAYALAALAATPALAVDSVIAGGPSSGTYYKVWAPNLAKGLKSHGFETATLKTKGCVENSKLVASGEADVGFCQGDALKHAMATFPEVAQNVDILGTLGKECGYAAVNTSGKLKSEDDIGEGIRVAAQKNGSGTQAGWAYMQSLEPDYAKATTTYDSGSRALGKVASGELDMTLWFTSPHNLDHRLLQTVLTNDSLKLLPLDDWSLDDKLPNGKSVYTLETVTVKKAGFGFDETITTLCTDAVVIGNTGADEELLDTVADIVMRNSNYILGK